MRNLLLDTKRQGGRCSNETHDFKKKCCFNWIPMMIETMAITSEFSDYDATKKITNSIAFPIDGNHGLY